MKRNKQRMVELTGGLSLEISQPLPHRPGVILVKVHGREHLASALPLSLGEAGFTRLIAADGHSFSSRELDVIEVSPVLRGAGVNTRLVAAKAAPSSYRRPNANLNASSDPERVLTLD